MKTLIKVAACLVLVAHSKFHLKPADLHSSSRSKTFATKSCSASQTDSSGIHDLMCYRLDRKQEQMKGISSFLKKRKHPGSASSKTARTVEIAIIV